MTGRSEIIDICKTCNTVRKSFQEPGRMTSKFIHLYGCHPKPICYQDAIYRSHNIGFGWQPYWWNLIHLFTDGTISDEEEFT